MDKRDPSSAVDVGRAEIREALLTHTEGVTGSDLCFGEVPTTVQDGDVCGRSVMATGCSTFRDLREADRCRVLTAAYAESPDLWTRGSKRTRYAPPARPRRG